jgi:uncharacterized protein YfaS (alpha-2-macroglobulin family)
MTIANLCYWSPNVNTNINGEANISFSTTATKGEYRIIVQGVSVAGLKPLYATKIFAIQ